MFVHAAVRSTTQYIIRPNLAGDLLIKYQNSKYENELSKNISTVQSRIVALSPAMINNHLRSKWYFHHTSKSWSFSMFWPYFTTSVWELSPHGFLLWKGAQDGVRDQGHGKGHAYHLISSARISPGYRPKAGTTLENPSQSFRPHGTHRFTLDPAAVRAHSPPDTGKQYHHLCGLTEMYLQLPGAVF